MLMAGVGSQGTGYNVDGGCWLPRDRGIMLIEGAGSLETGYNVDGGCWLPRDWV